MGSGELCLPCDGLRLLSLFWQVVTCPLSVEGQSWIVLMALLFAVSLVAVMDSERSLKQVNLRHARIH